MWVKVINLNDTRMLPHICGFRFPISPFVFFKFPCVHCFDCAPGPRLFSDLPHCGRGFRPLNIMCSRNAEAVFFRLVLRNAA